MTTQTIILAPDTTAADSTTVTVEDGATVTLGIYVASGSVPSGLLPLYKVTPGAPVKYTDGVTSQLRADRKEDEAVCLSRNCSVIQIAGPAQVLVRRPAGLLAAVGVYKEA